MAARRGPDARRYERPTREADRRHQWPHWPVHPTTVGQCRHSDIAPWHTPRAESGPLAGAPSPLQLIRLIRRFDPGEAYRRPYQRARQVTAGSGGIVKIPPLLRPSAVTFK